MLKLFGRTYKVRTLDRAEDENLGEARYRLGILWVDPKLTGILKARTLLHEMIHVGLTDMGSRYTDDEQYVTTMEFLITNIIHDNPSLIKDLKKKWQ